MEEQPVAAKADPVPSDSADHGTAQTQQPPIQNPDAPLESKDPVIDPMSAAADEKEASVPVESVAPTMEAETTARAATTTTIPVVTKDTPSEDNEQLSGASSRTPSIPAAPAAVATPLKSTSTTVSSDSGGGNPNPEDGDDTALDLEEYMKSPKGQNAIVERSPGGRYVRFLEKLGSGASKHVYRAYDTTEGIEVAWNVVTLSGVPKIERNRIVNEVRLLERLHHHNIISFHGSWVNREKQEVNFVTEILSSGTLKSFIDKVQVIRWKIAKRWAKQILTGLQYLHSQDPPVIHRDLKCENIFINGTSGDLRIGDFGLSTAHRNGKALSVLGTPEFMAPDLYEESAYDEKVDIYAFGMTLLEIFTKDFPYSECSNPAQIYKKVMKEEFPESLARLRSDEARNFIILCLGKKDEEGKYTRPTAGELLAHPFLAQSAEDDDSEVEVDPPLQQRVISEVSSSEVSRSSSGEVLKTSSSQQQPLTNYDLPPSSSELQETTKPQVTPPNGSSELEDSHVSDTFNDMPDSEVNMKKVKVMEGRGKELEEDESRLPSEPAPVPKETLVEDKTPKPLNGSGNNGAATDTAAPKYLVAAVALEHEKSPESRPYQDDILKLVIALPVEGETQTVHFDFHLVQDDPVKVAKEMVTELQIPPDTVLEISETISGLACKARQKQDKYNNRMKALAQQSKPPTATPQDVAPQQQTLPQTEQQKITPIEMDSQSVPDQEPTGIVPPQPTRSNSGSALSETEPQQQPPSFVVEQSSTTTTAEQPPAGQQIAAQSTLTQPQSQTKLPVQQPVAAAPDTSGQSGSSPRISAVEAKQNKPIPAPLPVPAVPVDNTAKDVKTSPNESAVTNIQDDEDDDDDRAELDEELRRLEEDFQKKKQRAETVFHNRMDNLQRSKQEREAQHMKTLEKHEKERIEFQKRLEAEAKEQALRLEQLQLELEEKRKTLAQEKKR